MNTPLEKVAPSAVGVKNSFQEDLVEHAEEALPTFSERQRVAIHHPQHADQREGHEYLHQHREHVLGAHQAAIEEASPGSDIRMTSAAQTMIQAVVCLAGRWCGAAAGAASATGSSDFGRAAARCLARSSAAGRRDGAGRESLQPRPSADATAPSRASKMANSVSWRLLKGLPHRFHRCGCE
jgi:hypothetical protein